MWSPGLEKCIHSSALHATCRGRIAFLFLMDIPLLFIQETHQAFLLEHLIQRSGRDNCSGWPLDCSSDSLLYHLVDAPHICVLVFDSSYFGLIIFIICWIFWGFLNSWRRTLCLWYRLLYFIQATNAGQCIIKCTWCTKYLDFINCSYSSF